MSGTQETINETMQVMHAVPLSPYDDKSKRGPYLHSESGDACDFYFFSLTEHGQRDKMILHPNAHENAERLAACWNYCRGIPTAALEGEAKSVIDLLRECLPIVNEYRAWKQADLSGLVDRIDAALAALAPQP